MAFSQMYHGPFISWPTLMITACPKRRTAMA